jgi:hypothetical protein
MSGAVPATAGTPAPVPYYGSATVLDSGAHGTHGVGGSGPVLGGSGHGIIGMRERVTLLGGEFSAGPLPGYGFQVTAHIPLPS